MLAGGVAVRGCAFGMGVFADGGARKGEVCFTEVPFAAVQTLASRCRAPACAHCLSPLGPLAAAVVAATCTGSGARALAAAHAAALSGGEASGGLPPLPGFEPPASGACACERSCGAVFCSPSCRSAARWHALLCDGQLAGESHPLAEFRRHAERTSESFVLAARCVATALAAAVDAGGTPEAVEAAVTSLQRFGFAGPWWTVAAASLAGPAPDVGDAAAHAAYKKKVKRLRSTLEEQLEESHQLLAVGLQHRHRLSAAQYRPLLDVEFFAAVAGTVELGIVPITFESPLTRYCRALTVAPRGDQARALTALRPVVEAAAVRTGVKLDDQGEPTQARRPDAARKASTSSDDGDDDDGEGGGGGKRARIDAAPASAADLQSASGIRWDDAPERVAASLATLAPAIFSGVEGVAMGATASMLNHSCVPNCQVDTAAGGMLALVPLCDVAAGSELLIAYTATAAPRAVRHAELRKHRFTCGCSRCAFDAAAEAGPPALELSLTALPPPALLALGRQAQEEGRHETAETLFAALSARAGEAASAGIAVGEAEHALGVSRLALGRWSAAHAAWADGARAAPEHPALQAQAAKDGSYWPAPNAPYDEVTHGPAAAPAFTLVPLGAGSSPAVLTAAPLLDAAGCARVVAAAEAAASSGGGWTTARHYDVPTTDMPLHTIPPLLRWFNGALRRSIAPLLAAAYPGGVFAGRVRVHDAFVVRYDAAAQRHLPVHRDQSVFSLTIALNPRAEFEGGGTYFADARTVVCPDAGHVLAFSGETRHGGEPITAGVRYIIAAFLYIADNE